MHVVRYLSHPADAAGLMKLLWLFYFHDAESQQLSELERPPSKPANTYMLFMRANLGMSQSESREMWNSFSDEDKKVQHHQCICTSCVLSNE